MMVFGEYYERMNIEVFGMKCFDVYHFQKNVFQYVLWYKANVAKVDKSRWRLQVLYLSTFLYPCDGFGIKHLEQNYQGLLQIKSL